MTDEVKSKAECRNIINRAGMTMIAEKRVENELVDNSNNQSGDVLSVLRTSASSFLSSFDLPPFSSQIKS
jgi:hypothetical protein